MVSNNITSAISKKSSLFEGKRGQKTALIAPTQKLNSQIVIRFTIDSRNYFYLDLI
jgi:hypothetical protein|tara:strand:+ start:168 stop:335 length:168 start_codon:yes stop_codon:yes gene_type:complete